MSQQAERVLRVGFPAEQKKICVDDDMREQKLEIRALSAFSTSRSSSSNSLFFFLVVSVPKKRGIPSFSGAKRKEFCTERF